MEHLQGIGVSCSSQQQSLMNALSRAEYFRDRLAVTADAASIRPSARRSSRNSAATTPGKFQRSRF
jgi:hypothetical protein